MAKLVLVAPLVAPLNDHRKPSGACPLTTERKVNGLPEKAVPPAGGRRMTGAPPETRARAWFAPAAMATTFDNAAGTLVRPGEPTPQAMTRPFERSARLKPGPCSARLAAALAVIFVAAAGILVSIRGLP